MSQSPQLLTRTHRAPSPAGVDAPPFRSSLAPTTNSAARNGMSAEAVARIAPRMNALLADFFALYVKSKAFHWHVAGPHFRDYHLLLDEQSTQLLATIDPIAERVRKLGARTVRSLAEISNLRTIEDATAQPHTASGMLIDLLEDNEHLAGSLRSLHRLCDENDDVASAGLVENWIDEAEGRAWFLREALAPEASGSQKIA